ncbi:MAG: pitrilysin family protein [Alphaproteobacteria bacterium]|nr:pitrilysin family protein [Alphaproteobacteria bacterium]
MTQAPRVTTLPNGLRVVSVHMPHLESAAIGIWVDSGARHEVHQMHGISHLLEHMAFKGTKRRSAMQIAEEIEAVGGHVNAYTSRENTAYFIRVLKNDVPLAVDILADILQESVFDPSELEREQDVVIQEIGQSLDTPDELIFDRLQESAYPDQAIGRTILGTPDSVGGMTPDILRGHMARNYRAQDMVLSAAGAVDHDALVELAQEKFSRLAQSMHRDLPHAHYQGGDAREVKDLEQVHLVMALEGVTYDDPDYFASQIFTTVLGEGMSSRLFQEVREKRGLCYSIYAFSSSFVDTGIAGVYAGTGQDRLGELVPVVIGEMQALAGSVRSDEVARACAQLKAGLLMGLESPGARCEQMARHLLIRGRLLTNTELVEKIDSVDVTAVQRYAERMLNRPKLAVSALGPITRLESTAKIAARFGAV